MTGPRKSVPAGIVPPVDKPSPTIAGLGTLVDRMMSRLPSEIVQADIDQGDPMRRYLSSMADQAGDVEVLLDRFYFDTLDDGGAPGETSDLADPNTADEAWLPWIGQFLGIKFGANDLPSQKRDALLKYQPDGGTLGAMVRAAQTELVGQQRCQVYSRATSLSDIGNASMWDMLVYVNAGDISTNIMSRTDTELRDLTRWSTQGTVQNDFALVTRTGMFRNTAVRCTPNLTGGNLEVEVGQPVPWSNGGVAKKFTVFTQVATKTARTNVVVGARLFDASMNVLGTQPLTITTGPNAMTSVRFVGQATSTTAFIQLYVYVPGQNAYEWVDIAQPGISTNPSDQQWASHSSDPLGAIVSLRQKPAGVVLHLLVSQASWANTQTVYPTWASVNGQTFDQIQQAGS